MQSMRENALKSIALKCAVELKGKNKNDLTLLTSITSKWLKKLDGLSVSKTEFLVEIGRVNGRLTDHREVL